MRIVFVTVLVMFGQHDAGLIDMETWRGLLDEIVAASEARKRVDYV